jgi:subtilisin family serine protease
VLDRGGHGTHVASTIAAPINGIGIAGVAPEAEIVALKACVAGGYCMADSVAAALRYAGDVGLDVVNLSLFADPYHFYCKNTSEERAILRDLQSATRYAQQRGVAVVVSAGNDAWDLQHPPDLDGGSPNPGDAVERRIGNNCVVAPGELPGVITVSALGPWGLADYSTTGMSRVDVGAPGGDYFQGATAHNAGVTSAVLAAASSVEDPDHGIYAGLAPLDGVFPGVVVEDAGAPYMQLNGTSMAAPHATGVIALIKQLHPNMGSGALKSALQRTATDRPCPAAGAVDDFFSDPAAAGYRACQGDGGRNSYFGHGVVNASGAVS